MEIRRYATVSNAAGEIGRVTHVIVDPATGDVTHLTVDSLRGERLIPIGAVQSAEGDRVVLRGYGAMLDEAPAFERAGFSAVDDQGFTQDAGRRTAERGVPLLDADGEAVVLPDSAVRNAPSAHLGGAGTGTGADENRDQLELREERLRAETQPEQAGVVLVHRRVTEHVETIEVPVREERLVLERRPGSGPVTIEGRVLQEGETFEIVLMRERVVVHREPVAYEAVNIRREVVERMERVEGTVRREQLAVDDPLGAVASIGGGADDWREGTQPNSTAPAPIGYRPGPRAAAGRADAAGLDAQPTEPFERPRAAGMYDPEPTPAVYASAVPGRENTSVMEDAMTDAQTTGSPADVHAMKHTSSAAAVRHAATRRTASSSSSQARRRRCRMSSPA
jgi:uncharacterized protein (TIGR02271 family)